MLYEANHSGKSLPIWVTTYYQQNLEILQWYMAGWEAFSNPLACRQMGMHAGSEMCTLYLPAADMHNCHDMKTSFTYGLMTALNTVEVPTNSPSTYFESVWRSLI